MRARWLPLPIAVSLALAGCPATGVTPTTKPTRKPGVAATARPGATPGPGVLQAATLVGKAKLVASAAGALGTGATLISDNGGGLIANNGGGIISNNAGGIIANHGSGYRVQQAAAGLAVYALAEAVVTLTDAAGAPIVDAVGKAIETKTDAQGDYAFTQDLPEQAMVAHVRLFNGGELQALVVNDGAAGLSADLDTASTLGATYVLSQFVKGDQKVLAKLPRGEAERLKRELGVVDGYLGSAPGYQAADMVAATDKLRAKVKAVDTVIEDVRALLLGQSQLGQGLLATEVPFAGPVALTAMPDGSLVLGESWPGRLRTVGPDGKVGTLMDTTIGRIKSNVLRIADAAVAPDGTWYVVSETWGMHRARPGASTTTAFHGDVETKPRRVAVATDGTFYLGEDASGSRPRGRLMTAVGDGPLTEVVLPVGAATTTSIDGLAPAPDGGMYALWYDKGARRSTVFKVLNGTATALATPASDGGRLDDMAIGPDGTLYVSQVDAGKVFVYAPATGALTPVPSDGAPPGRPESIAVGRDGTLYAADADSNFVHARAKDGPWKIFAGTDSVVEEGATTRFAINQPAGVAFDTDGSLLIAEMGAGRVRRFRNGKLEPFAGGKRAADESTPPGDGGPATAAAMVSPTNLYARNGEVWISDTGGFRIRHVGPDGVISTVAGIGNMPVSPLDAGMSTTLLGAPIGQPSGLTVDPAGNIYFCTGHSNQVYRVSPSGNKLEALLGPYRRDDKTNLDPGVMLGRDETQADAPLGFPMGVTIGPDGLPYFAEMAGCRVARIKGAGTDGPVTVERVAGLSLFDMLTKGPGIKEAGGNLTPDGVPATESAMCLPTAVIFDAAGAMYVAEAGTAQISALRGASIGAFDVSVLDAVGLPTQPGRVRKVTRDGVVTTIAGVGSRLFPDLGGDNALALPMGLALAPDGRLAIADMAANQVRILPAGSY